jgi:hypothetical protein
MVPPPEFEPLRTEIQKAFADYVNNEVALAFTFLELGQFEYDKGETQEGWRSFIRARQASN